MKAFLIPVLFLVVINNFCYSHFADTSFHADLDNDNVREKITGEFEEWEKFESYTGQYKLRINDKMLIDSFDFSMGFEMNIDDIDAADSYKELLVKSLFEVDSECRVYRYVNKKITLIGSFLSGEKIITPGDGTITTSTWMGFWLITKRYKIDKDENIIKLIPEDTYEVKYYNSKPDIKATHQFSLKEIRDDRSNNIAIVNIGDKINILQADINIEPPAGTDEWERTEYFWYLIQTPEGTQGWIRLKDIKDNVEGIPWAG